jgi:hypothetical protein
MLFKTDPLIQCVKDETDNMIIQGVARAGVHVDKDELIKALEYDRGQYEKGFHDGRMYIPPNPSHADLVRVMSDEELATWIFTHRWNDYSSLLDWLKQEAEEGE